MHFRSLFLLSVVFPTTLGYHLTVHQHPSEVAGCGPMVQTGYLWDCEDNQPDNSWTGIIPKGDYGDDIQQNFCTGNVNSVPLGSYCFYRNGRESSCPPGFTAGTRQQDEENEGNKSGGSGNEEDRPVLTINSGSRPTWHFCCGSGDPKLPISFDAIRDQLPKAFTLFRKGSSCQKINGRTVSTGEVYWDDEDDINLNSYSGSVPAGDLTANTRFHYCTYSESSLPYPAIFASMTSRGSTTATVSWTTGSGATRYQLRLYQGSSLVQSFDGVSTTSHTFNSLTPNTAYSLRIYSGITAGPTYETGGVSTTFSTCLSGYAGATCTPVCSPSCSHGNCTSPGVCSCDSGWEGSTCDLCTYGFYPTWPSSCAACPTCNHGSCSDGPTGTGECFCQNGYIGTHCNECKSDYYSSGGECLPCDSTCATCQHSATHCLSCRGNLILSSENTCISSCVPGQYLDGTCHPCDDSCETCFGPGSSSCLTCPPGRLKDGSKCLLTCPFSKYNDSQSVCQNCNSLCTDCFGAGSSACHSCATNYNLRDTSCITNSACTSEGGYVEGGNCLLCHPSCLTCSGQNSSNCLTCDTASFLHNGECLDSCPDGTYHDHSIRRCVECHSHCGTCTDESASSCLTCTADRLMYGAGCVTECPSGKFNNSGSCAECHPSCSDCHDSTAHSCSSCKGGYFLREGSCTDVSGCTSGGGYIQGTNCSSCDPTCLTCSGPLSTECLACSPGKWLYDGECLSQCPLGTYPFDPTHQCFPCASQCATCSSGSTYSCLSCEKPFFLEETQCVSNCSAGYVLNSAGICTVQVANTTMSTLEQWLPIGVYGAVGCVSVILYIVARWKNPKARNILIILVAISFVECATDALFLLLTYRLPDKIIFFCSLFFTLFPMLLNIGLVTMVFIRETKRGDGKGDFLVKHSTVATLVAFISMTNVTLLRFLDSKIFNLEAFSMNWDQSTHLRGKVFGLVSDVFDNIPQIAIQSTYLCRYGADGVAIASIVVSSVSLITGVIHKLLLLLVLRLDPPTGEFSNSKEMVIAPQ